jgi:hypothetical protein
MGIPAPILALMQNIPLDSDGEVSYGQKIYDIHDVLCYGVSVYENGQHQTKDWQSLRNAVNEWQNKRELNWQPAEIDEVSAYLNMRFFHYPTPGGEYK